jgi:hypothetical protein
MAVRAKFIVSSKTETPYPKPEKGGGYGILWNLEMAAVWEGAGPDGSNIATENHIFSKATPSGKLTMCITNEAAANALKTGECYYLDFIPAGLPAYAKTA